MNPDKFVTELKLTARVSWLLFQCSLCSLMLPQALRSWLLVSRVLCCFKPLNQGLLFFPQECPLSLPFACLADNAIADSSQAIPLLSEALPLPHSLAFLYIYLLILSLHPLPYLIGPCPHNPARAEM